MDKDYGRRAKRKPSRGERTALVGGLGLCLAIVVVVVGASWRQGQARIDAEAPYWAVTGPPCPAASPPLSPQPVETFDYADVGFARAFGHASCTLVAYRWSFGLARYPECEFTSPGVLKITTSKGDFYFAPGWGRPATVFAENARPRCVLNSNFR